MHYCPMTILTVLCTNLDENIFDLTLGADIKLYSGKNLSSLRASIKVSNSLLENISLTSTVHYLSSYSKTSKEICSGVSRLQDVDYV